MATEKNVYRLVIGAEEKVSILSCNRDISTGKLNGVIYWKY